MTPLQQAARAVVNRWETPLWKDAEPTAAVVYRLRDALEAELATAQPEPAAPTEPAPGWCKHCRQYTIEEPLQAAPTAVEPPAGWLIYAAGDEANGAFWRIKPDDEQLETMAVECGLPVIARPLNAATPPQAPTVVEPVAWVDQETFDCLVKNQHGAIAYHRWLAVGAADSFSGRTIPLFAATPPRAALGERTTQVLNDLQSALGMMLTFFGMDEDENSESVFDTARQAYQYAQIVLRPIEPHEREALAKLRSTLHQWHESAVAKGFDGVASMLDSVAAAPTVVEPSRWENGEGWESLAWQLCADENGEDACNELIWEGGAIPEPWGDRWMKYEGEAKRLIALVHKHVATPPRAPLPDAEWCVRWILNNYQNHLNLASLCEHLLEAAHGIVSSAVIAADRGEKQ